MGCTSIAVLPGQESVGRLVLETELHESEAELSETSVPGKDAVGNSQLPSQHLAFINADTRSEANSPGANIETAYQLSPKVIYGERMTLQASNESDGTRPVLEINNHEQMTREKTCERNPVILDWKESDVGRTDPEEMKMSDVMTSCRTVEVILRRKKDL